MSLKFLILLSLFLVTSVHSRGGQSMVNGIPSEHQPFMVSVRNRFADDPFGGGHVCGGTIVAFNLVLTAASCIQNPPATELTVANVLIIAGTNMRYDQSQAFAINAREIFVHPSYVVSDRANNIAVIETIGMPRNGVNIQPIVLTREAPLAGDECRIFGFGQAGSLSAPSQLQTGQIQIVDTSACHDHRSHAICSNSDTFPCNGDEGGPVVCDNRLTAIIDHFGFEHCRTSEEVRRTSYIGVADFNEWIGLHIWRVGVSEAAEAEAEGRRSAGSAVKITQILIASTLIAIAKSL